MPWSMHVDCVAIPVMEFQSQNTKFVKLFTDNECVHRKLLSIFSNVMMASWQNIKNLTSDFEIFSSYQRNFLGKKYHVNF